MAELSQLTVNVASPEVPLTVIVPLFMIRTSALISLPNCAVKVPLVDTDNKLPTSKLTALELPSVSAPRIIASLLTANVTLPDAAEGAKINVPLLAASKFATE